MSHHWNIDSIVDFCHIFSKHYLGSCVQINVILPLIYTFQCVTRCRWACSRCLERLIGPPSTSYCRTAKRYTCRISPRVWSRIRRARRTITSSPRTHPTWMPSSASSSFITGIKCIISTILVMVRLCLDRCLMSCCVNLQVHTMTCQYYRGRKTSHAKSRSHGSVMDNIDC